MNGQQPVAVFENFASQGAESRGERPVAYQTMPPFVGLEEAFEERGIP